FKEKYLETKHPYPALLDCDVLNENLEQRQKSVGDEDKTNKNLFVNKGLSYADIEADIAWELNLGLPRKCGFVAFLPHTFGRGALCSALNAAGANLTTLRNGKRDYIRIFNLLKKERVNIDFDAVYYRNKDIDKTMHLLPKNTLALLASRDPIDSLTSFLNVRWPKQREKYYKSLTLDDTNFKEIADRTRFLHGGVTERLVEYATFKGLDLYYHESLLYMMMFYDYVLKTCKNFDKYIIVDFQENLPDNTFSTINALSKKLNIKGVKFEDISYLKSNKAAAYALGLPITLYVNEEINIVINNFVPSQNDIIELNESNFLQIESPYLKLYYLIDKSQYEILNKDLCLCEKVRVWIKKFHFELNEHWKETKSRGMTNEKMLDFLRKETKYRKIFKELFDKNFAYIKQTRPDIIASWKYYNEFEKMCEELDKKA
ncbi:hypothetical protein DMB95_01480, partial [Campylobacter sp. MIT 12-8780]